jgi:lysophospholipase L1-like esterase
MNTLPYRRLAIGFGSALAVLTSDPAWAGDATAATEPVVVGMVAEPCPPPLDIPPPVRAFNQAFIAPGKVDMPRMLALTKDPAFVAYNAAKSVRDEADWAGLCRYRRDNDAIAASGQRPRAVFFGDSITENWVLGDERLFGPGVIGRGIGGQTTAQMLVRFRSDVIDLRPRVVQIMAGTNDLAGNKGPTSERDYQNNIMAMVELARAHRIRVVLASIPPAGRFFWRPEVAPAPQIERLNAWLRNYARREKLTFVDYHAVLAGPEGAMRPGLSLDGVHPNRDGYAAMRALAGRVR